MPLVQENPSYLREATIGPRQILGALGTGIIVALLFITLVCPGPNEGLRNSTLFGVVVLIMGANALASHYLLQWIELDLFRLLTTAFVAIGILVLAASLLNLYPNVPLLPRRSEYIFRQAYFVILWLPFLIGSFHLWATSLPFLMRWLRRYGICLLLAIPVIDISTALIFSDPAEAWDGYLYYVEKSVLQFLLSTSFLVTVLFGGQRTLAMIIIIVYFLICRLNNIGTMFNTLSALMTFIMLVIAAFPYITHRSRILLSGAVCGAMLVGMGVCIVSPSIYSAGHSTDWASRRAADAVWRAQAWRQNLLDLADSDFIGLGFGVPYHPMTARNLIELEEYDFSSDEGVRTLDMPVSEYLYVRGQHSSIINLFYRFGLFGGVLFLALNSVLFARLVTIATVDAVVARLSVMGATLFLIAFLQLSVNVGLETPRFFLIYMLSMSFCLYCLEVAACKRPRRLGRVVN